MKTQTLALMAALSLAAQPSLAKSPQAPADTLFFGGSVITMDPAHPTAEAVAVRDGRILALGRTRALEKVYGGAQTQRLDLAGKTLMPGFIDPHSHITSLVTTWGLPSLSPPPVGDVATIADIVTKVRVHIQTAKIPAGTLVVASGYDDSLLAEGRHPTAADLDAISANHPVILIHVSGHLAAANTKALALVGYNRDTPDPKGGVIRRLADGTPSGVLEELALMPFLRLIPAKSMDEQVKILGEVQAYYASLGITTAQDGISTPAEIALLQEAARRKALVLDVVAYPRWSFMKAMACDDKGTSLVPLSGAPLSIGLYQDRLRIGGVKLTGDGSPQGKTAYLTLPYVHPPHGLGDDYRGYPVATVEALDHWYGEAYRCKVQVLFHANGDAAADMMLAAVAKAQSQYGQQDLRPVMIHAQMIRHDQVDTMARLKVMPSFFTEHTFFWGDWHVNETVGKARAFGMSPTGYALSKGIRFTIHTDAPVLPPNHLTAVWTAVNRVSRSGLVVGPDERISVMEALKAVTLNAAYQYKEEDQKGSISPGKRADLIILDHNPLGVDPMTLKDIKVVQTFKDGRSIYQAP